MAKAETATLAAKLVRVMADIKQPAQSKRHEYQKFDYSTRDDIFQVVRVALVHAGIAVTTSLTLVSQEAASPTSRGVAQTRSLVRLDVLLIDSETGEELPTTWVGEAVTTEDKGIQGAATQAARFWAIQQFMLMDGRESELHSDEGPAAPEPARQRVQTSSVVGEIKGSLSAKGLSDVEVGQMLAYIVAQEKVGKLEQVKKLNVWAKRLAEASVEDIRKRIEKVAA